MSEARNSSAAAVALGLMTALPVGAHQAEGERSRAAAWFALVGAAFGLIGYALVKGAGMLGLQSRAPYLIAAIVLAVWAVVGRLWQWKALADVAESLFGATRRPESAGDVAGASRGGYGAGAISLTALLEAAALGAIIARPHELPVLLIPVIARFSATAACWLGTARNDDVSARHIVGHPSGGELMIGVIPLAGALVGLWLGFHVVGIALGVLGLFAAFAVPHLLAQRVGGVTTAVLGTSVVLVEMLMFVVVALVV